VKNWRQKPTPVSGASFWRRFLERVSSALDFIDIVLLVSTVCRYSIAQLIIMLHLTTV